MGGRVDSRFIEQCTSSDHKSKRELQKCSELTILVILQKRRFYAMMENENSDEFERERPRSGPGDFNLVLDPLYLLLLFGSCVSVRPFKSLPLSRLLVPSAAQDRRLRHCT
ncbi:unnamed protein product [Ilex paraguariensis]|uniref:Uncharacterized protein n=1 Tax=Ilex paraguariensis TaxID=185542 RepID=A0ABC8RBD6_9AQUA